MEPSPDEGTTTGAPGTPVLGPADAAIRRVLDAAEVPVAILDPDGRLLGVNPAFARSCGRAGGELVGLHAMALCPGQDQAGVLSALVHVVSGVADVEQEELRIVGSDGRVRMLRLTLGALPDASGRVDRILAVAADLTAERREERRRRQDVVSETRAATQDADTGLPNERALRLMTSSAARRAEQTGSPFALLRCDVTNLDDIEQELGAAAAQWTLRLLSERLTQRLRASDSVTRIDRATFAVLAEDLGDPQDAAGVAYRLLASVIEPVVIEGANVQLALTVGVVVADGATVHEHLLLAAADAAAEARQDGGGGFRMADLRSPAPMPG